MTITERADDLMKAHSSICSSQKLDFHRGVVITPEECYEFDEKSSETVFNQPFFELVLKIGVIDSEQTPEERAQLGQRYIIPVKSLSEYCSSGLKTLNLVDK